MVIPMTYLWNGQRIDEMDRDSLLEAFKSVADELAATRRLHEIDRRMQQTFREFGYERA